MLNSRSVFNVVGGYAGWWSDYSASRQADKYGLTLTPARLDLRHGLTSGHQRAEAPRCGRRIAGCVDAGYTLHPAKLPRRAPRFKAGLTY